MAGSIKAVDVLRMTTSTIAECVDPTAAWACLAELDTRLNSNGVQQVPPNFYTYNALISVHDKVKDFEGAEHCFDVMRSRGVAPDVSTYNNLMSMYARVGRAQDASKWFSDLLANDVVPDIVAYGTVIKAHANAADAQGARRWFHHLLSNSERFGLTPNLIIYNTLISAQVKAGKLENARQCFDHMLEWGDRWNVVPDIATYTSLISAHENAKDHATASALLEKAIQGGVFEPSLGFHQDFNRLDLPAAVSMQNLSRDRTVIAAPVAKVIFRYLADKGKINRDTTFVLGHQLLTAAIAQCMEDCGWIPIHPRGGRGGEYRGALVAQAPSNPRPTVSLVAQPLNPGAAAFTPARKDPPGSA